LYSRLYFRSRVSRTRLHTRVQSGGCISVYTTPSAPRFRLHCCIGLQSIQLYTCTLRSRDSRVISAFSEWNPRVQAGFSTEAWPCRQTSAAGYLLEPQYVQYNTAPLQPMASACSSEITLRVPSYFGQLCGGTRYLCPGLLLHTNLRTMYTQCFPSRQLLSVFADCKLSVLDREIIALSFLPSELYPGVGRDVSSVALIPYGISCCFGTYAPYEIVPSGMSLTLAYHVVQQRALTPRGPRAQACSWRRRWGLPLPPCGRPRPWSVGPNTTATGLATSGRAGTVKPRGCCTNHELDIVLYIDVHTDTVCTFA
jgi:hypothetical protein